MKLSLENIKNLKQKSDNLLVKKACNYVIEHWQDYENKTNIFTDVLHYGCQSGMVSELTYYSETMAFYNKFKKEINTLLYELMEGCGLFDPSQLFRDKWDKEDPLANDTTNQNLLAWFGFEETLRSIGQNFEVLQEKI
ncbi:MAG: hypothetical protein PHR96_03570 [Clostridia bacterium]|nr:hypothetical protein [Clostridia bacterium]